MEVKTVKKRGGLLLDIVLGIEGRGHPRLRDRAR
jgi:hypothetical protein